MSSAALYSSDFIFDFFLGTQPSPPRFHRHLHPKMVTKSKRLGDIHIARGSLNILLVVPGLDEFLDLVVRGLEGAELVLLLA